MTYANGDIYTGSFHQNARHGSGRYEWHANLKSADSLAEQDDEADEEEEEPEAEDGEKPRKAPKALYEGEYEHGARTGKGKLTYPDGTIYTGMGRIT